MPHRRRSLLRGLPSLAPAALLFVVVACSSDSASERADNPSPPPSAERSDPAASLDREFQRARSALNAEAVALAKIDRTSAEYTSRYEAWLREAAAAESLRARRDSVRRSPKSATPAT